MSSRKLFWMRTSLEIVVGFFLVTPLIMYVLDEFNILPFPREGWYELLFIALIYPWTPYLDTVLEAYWAVYPYFFVLGFFLLHVIFARARFPRLLSFFRRVRPFMLLFIASYFATGWFRVVSSGEEVRTRSNGIEMYAVTVPTSGFPFRFSIDDPSFSGSSGYSLFQLWLFLADVSFYLVLFAVAWFAVHRLVRHVQERRRLRDVTSRV